MTGRVPLLGGILILQVLLIGLVTFGGDGGENDSTDNFLNFDPAAVTGFSIADGEGAVVSLSRSEDGWQLDSGLPADATKVADVIDKLAGVQATWPVATSASSQSRFEVTEDKHQRRLTLTDGDAVLAEIYLGTSPGYRRVHARAAGDDAVYSIDFANHEVPARPDDWLDKNLLQTDGISQISLDGGWGWKINRASTDADWLVDGAVADADAVQKLIDRLQNLRVDGFFEGDPSELGEPQVVNIVDGQGAHQLTLRHDLENDDYLLISDRVDGRFRLPSYAAEQILLTADELLAKTEVAAPDPS